MGMAGCWRLLGSSLILVAPLFLAPTVLAQSSRPAARGAAIAPITLPDLPGLRGAEFRDPGVASPVPIPPELPRSPPVAPGFRHLVGTAGIIFTGRVVAVGRGRQSREEASAADSFARPDAASTEVTFLVEHALRGATQGQRLTIHEWGGLSARGKRYYVGERLMLFLYSPSTLGLTSPVAGNMGRFAVDSRDRVVMSAQHIVDLENDPILRGRVAIPYDEFALAVRRFGGKE